MSARRRRLSLLTLALLVLGAACLEGCTIARPFEGPGWDPDGGVTLAGPDRVAVALTHATLDKALRDPFDEHSERVVDSLLEGRHPGLIAFSTRRELIGDEVWTMTVWRDAPDLQRFFTSDVHGEAMSTASDAILRIHTRRLTLSRKELPLTWERALALLVEAQQ